MATVGALAGAVAGADGDEPSGARAWCEQFHFALAAVSSLLAKLDTLLPALDPATAAVLAGHAAPLRALILMLRSDPAAAQAQTEIGLKETPADDRYIRSMAVISMR